MAVLSHSRLAIIFEVGINESGGPIFSNKYFNNVKNGATDAQLEAIATNLVPLQEHPVTRMDRTNVYTLM